jgi:hypothetical protein
MLNDSKMIFQFGPFVITREAVQTIWSGALGALTLGAFTQVQNIEAMRLNNEHQEKMMKLNNELQDRKVREMVEEADKKRRWFK